MDSISLIKTPIEAELEDFKALFDTPLSDSNALLDSVITHIRKRNGKMMRPILVLLVARLYGAVTPATLHAAVSLELLHTASLVHDDVVDESTERRGQLSVNAIFNNKVSVLAGDYLLATSLVHAEQTNNYVSNHSFSEEVYFDVIRKKTAALFAACAEAAALSVQVGEEEVAFARLLGEYIGICFQIKDDIFDYFDSKKIGKPTGNDMLERKLTLPALYALNTTKDAWAEQIAFKVKEGTATPDEIVRLIEFTKDNGGIEYACRTIEQYKKKAFDLLAALPDSNICLALRTYLDYVVAREK